MELKPLGCVDDDFGEEQLQFGKKCRVSNQLVELPIEHQIYDTIDAAGSQGLTVMEVDALISFLCFNLFGAALKIYGVLFWISKFVSFLINCCHHFINLFCYRNSNL